MANNYINQNAPKAFFPSYSPSTTSSSNPLLNPPVSQNQSNFFESTQQAFNAGRGGGYGGGGYGGGGGGSPQDISNKMDVLQLLATQKKMGLEADYGLLPKEQRDVALRQMKASGDYWSKLKVDQAKKYFSKEQQDVTVAQQKANENYWTKQNQKYQFQ